MKRYNLNFWGSYRMAGVVKSSAKRKLGRDIRSTGFGHGGKSFTSSNVDLFQISVKWKLTDFPISLCFQLNSSGLQKVTKPKLTMIYLVI